MALLEGAEILTKGCTTPVLLSVEAIIGAGKSTLLEQLDALGDIVVVREPVDLWQQQRGGESLLSRYYGDQKANAFMFETYAMMSRVKALRQALTLVTPETRAIVMERSWISSARCFAENSKELGHLDTLEASLHEDLFNWGLETWPKIDAVVLIDVAVTVAQGRVAVRGRTEESIIPSDYQEALVQKHRQWLHGSGAGAFDGAVLTLDGSGHKADGAVDRMVMRVTEFIDKLHAAKNNTQVLMTADQSKCRRVTQDENTDPKYAPINKVRKCADVGDDSRPSFSDMNSADAFTYLTPEKTAK